MRKKGESSLLTGNQFLFANEKTHDRTMHVSISVEYVNESA
jgi:hypothetical protein